MAVAVTRSVGMLLLAIYLIISGLAGFAALPIPGALMALLALLAGIFILVGGDLIGTYASATDSCFAATDVTKWAADDIFRRVATPVGGKRPRTCRAFLALAPRGDDSTALARLSAVPRRIHTPRTPTGRLHPVLLGM